MTAPRLSEVLEVLDSLYDPRWADPWDRVGPVCGSLGAVVERVLFAVDPTAQVIAEAIEQQADLLVVHHPLLLTPVSSVAATTPKGRAVHDLIGNGIALVTAHTNADTPAYGVNDALARAIGIVEPRVLLPSDEAAAESTRGHGRLGELPDPVTLREFAAAVAQALPATAHGVRVAGDPDRRVATVAVGAGAGDSLLEVVAGTDADVYLTSDLRHHRASEFLELGGPALVDVAHWAAEWTWLPVAEARLTSGMTDRGYTVDTRVSALVTDPWTFRADR